MAPPSYSMAARRRRASTRLLRRAGVRRLAMVVATHASRDHHGGLREVLEQFDVGLFLDGGDGTRDPGFRAVVAEAERRGVRRLPARAPLDLRAGRIRVHVLGPAPRPPGPPPDDPNRRAVVAVVSVGAFDLLLSARRGERRPVQPRAAGRGCDQGAPPRQRRPGAARCASAAQAGAGRDRGRPWQPYGHPAPSTVAALRRARVATYRTDRHGTVTLTVEGMASAWPSRRRP